MANNTNANTATPIGIKPWMLVIPVVLVALCFLPSTVVICAGMVPTLVARVVDTSIGKRLSVTVGAMNLVGCLYFLHRLWIGGQSVNDIPVVLGEGVGWLSALMGAAAGWVIFGFMPLLITKIAQTQTALRLHRIVGEQDRLVKEWGEDVRGVHGTKVSETQAGEV